MQWSSDAYGCFLYCYEMRCSLLQRLKPVQRLLWADLDRNGQIYGPSFGLRLTYMALILHLFDVLEAYLLSVLI